MTKAAKSDVFSASSGLKLRLKKVSPFILQDVGKKVSIPTVPVVYIEDKGRSEENPNDPDYLKAVQDATNERGTLIVTTMLVLGTEILSLPDGMAGPEDDEWVEVLEAVDIDVPKHNKRLRYCTWLKYIGLPDGDEFQELTKQILRFGGVTLEEDVKDAEASFRADAKGNALNSASVETVA